MKFLGRLIQWGLAGLTLIFLLASLKQPIALVAFSLGLLAIVPPLVALWQPKLPVAKGWMRLLLWFLVVNLGFTAISNGSAETRAKELAQQNSTMALITLLQQPGDRQEAAALALGLKQDKQALQPLIATLATPTSPPELHTAAATALGQIQDPRAIEPLAKALQAAERDTQTAAKAAIAQIAQKHPQVAEKFLPAFRNGDEQATQVLTAMGTPVTPNVIPSLQSDNALVRLNAALVLSEVGDARAIKPLVASLTDWYANEAAGKGLQRLGWQPTTAAETVHFRIALKQGEALNNDLSTTRQVLLQAVQSEDLRTIEYGLYAFISLGDQSILSTLTQLLTEKGDKTMALAYLNCGEPTLRKAAEDWASQQGYKIVQTAKPTHSVKWGKL